LEGVAVGLFVRYRRVWIYDAERDGLRR